MAVDGDSPPLGFASSESPWAVGSVSRLSRPLPLQLPTGSFPEQSLAEWVASGNVVFNFGKSPLSPFI